MQCISDAESMAPIGTNSIRIYHVDPYADHDGCMAAFSDKGIYVWLDLDTFQLETPMLILPNFDQNSRTTSPVVTITANQSISSA